ncbi:MAG: carbohydrate kinase family protein [Conexivisphaera sp.]|jgi:ribokinase|nr:carbohydrate kinase family protein [Conexivisphaerales archaeon]
MAGPDLLVVSDCVMDIYLRVGAFPVPAGAVEASPEAIASPGGSCYLAAAASRFGARVEVVDVVGDDPLGSQLISDMESRGVSMRRVRRSGSTGLVAVLEDGRGRSSFIGSWGSGSQLSRGDLERAVDDGPRMVYLSGYSLLGSPRREAVESIPELARDVGAVVAVDPGPLSGSSGSLIRSAGIVLLNEEELQRSSPDISPDALLVVKMGPRGARAHSGQLRVESPAIHVNGIASAVGAGEVFDGVLLARLLSGSELREALDFANAAAGLKLRGRGLDSIPDPREVEEILG